MVINTSTLALVIEAKYNNSMFTCQVNDGAFMGSQTITITTGCELNPLFLILDSNFFITGCSPTNGHHQW